MVIKHILGLFTHPKDEWVSIRDEQCSIAGCFASHTLFLAAIPAISGFIGTTQIGWQIGVGPPSRLTTDSALYIAVLYYLAMLVAVATIGALIHWMGKTYDAEQPLSRTIILASYTATPLFLIGLFQLYPILWLNMILGLPALAYTVYLLYIGLPIMMDISSEQGFLFSSAVLAVGLVTLVATLAATAILWGYGFEPVLTAK